MSNDEIEGRITAMYRQDPAGFVAARARLAAEVKADDPGRAKQIAKLRKPTVAAWALNAVVQQDPARVAELRQAGVASRRAQAGAVGDGSEAVLRDAEKRRRSVLHALADAAVDRASEGQREEIEATLEAASVDEGIGEELTAGRLTRAHPRPSGFGDLAAMLSASTTDPPPAPDQARVEDLKRRLSEADSLVEQHRRELARAEERLAAAQGAVGSLEQRVLEVTAERDQLQSDLDSATA